METFTRNFEMEYDGKYYEIDAEYVVEQDLQSHAFGTRVLQTTIPVGFVVYSGGNLLTPVDKDLKAAIWRECDRYAE